MEEKKTQQKSNKNVLSIIAIVLSVVAIAAFALLEIQIFSVNKTLANIDENNRQYINEQMDSVQEQFFGDVSDGFQNLRERIEILEKGSVK